MPVLGNPIWLLGSGSVLPIIFYDAGDEYTAITGGWEYVVIGSAGAGLTKDTTRMLLKGNPDGAQTHNGFDATRYTTIYFDVASSATYDSMVGISPTGGDADLDTSSMIYKSAKQHNFSRKTISVDITGATGTYWPTVWTRASSAGISIYKVWAE